MNRLLAVFFALLFGTIAQAETYYIFEATGSNVPKEDTIAVTELIRSAVAESGNHSVSSDSKSSHALRPKVLKLGSAYMVTLEKVVRGDVKFSSQLKSSSMEEMDKVIPRLVRAVTNEKTAKDDTRVDEVTDSESQGIGKRKATLKRWYLGMGPGATSNLNNSNTLLGFSLAFAWDMPDVALKLVWENVGSAMAVYGLGGQYYFSQGSTSPLLAATFGYGNSTKTAATGLPDETASGFALGLGVGYQILRTSSVGCEFTLYSDMLFTKNSVGYPMMYGLRVGFYF